MSTLEVSYQPADFMSTDASCQFSVDYSKFGNITKTDFINYANIIDKYAYTTAADGSKKYLTFKEFFEREGFKFPTNNNADYLLLGAEKGKDDYSDWYNNGWKYRNCIALYCVDLNMTVHEFVQTQAFKNVYYFLYISKVDVGGTCGSSYEERWFIGQSTNTGNGNDFVYAINYGTSLSAGWRGTPITFYTIFGLSNNSRNDVYKFESN